MLEGATGSRPDQVGLEQDSTHKRTLYGAGIQYLHSTVTYSGTVLVLLYEGRASAYQIQFSTVRSTVCGLHVTLDDLTFPQPRH